jgi:ribulose-phosphate 3-epimerase
MAGIALNSGDPVSDVIHLIDHVDLLLVMSVHPGFGGQPLMPATLDKVRELRRRAETLDRPPRIGLDGGINPDTIEDCVAAGANFLAMGTAIYGDRRPAENLRELRRMIRGLVEGSRLGRMAERHPTASAVREPGQE